MKIFKNKKTALSAALLILTLPFSLAGCAGSSDPVNLEALHNANTVSTILETHTSIYEEFSYYENLDNNETFHTSFCYSEDENGNAVYQASGSDAIDTSSPDNFNYCIVNNIQYFNDNSGKMILYPLTADYLEEFKSNSFTLSTSELETLKSVSKESSEIVLTSETMIDALYDEETISNINTLCNDTVTAVKNVYRADRDTLLLNSVKTYYIGEKAEYLFSEEKITYDRNVPDLVFASEYLNPAASRTVTIIEKTDTEDISTTYTLPANVSPDLFCFTSYCGYSIFNDVLGLDPFISETPDENGNYQNITLYAMHTDNTTSENGQASDTSGSDEHSHDEDHSSDSGSSDTE